jgi:arylsulfatase A-like enzyme
MKNALIILVSLYACVTFGARPNILFIFTDDHSSQAISAYGSKINQTPHMDRIAKEGMLFRNCFVSNAICGPSRAVIQTGKYSHLNGFLTNGNSFDGSQQTFPKLLQKAGYQTAVVGKWHLKTTPTGFDYSEVLVGQGPYYNPPMKKNGENTKHIGYTTEIITDLALDWLQNERDEDEPFMLMYQHKAPHRNWQPGPGYLNRYDDVTIPEPETLFYDYSGLGSAAKQQQMSIEHNLSAGDLKLTPPGGLTPEQLATWNAAYEPKNAAFKAMNLQGKELIQWKYQRYIKDYIRCVDAVDDNIGRVLKYLDDTGLAENTIVIYSSDQGWFLGENGWFDKRWIYDVSLRMPLLVRWPGVVKPGTENTDFVSNVDFAQTFLDIAGVEQPADMQGRSFVPLLKGQTPDDWRKSFYYQYYEYPGAHSVRRHYGVRAKDHTLVYYYGIDEWELFDNRKDPNQLTSVYNNPEYAEVVKKLQQEIDQLRVELKVPVDERPIKAKVRTPRTPKPKKNAK